MRVIDRKVGQIPAFLDVFLRSKQVIEVSTVRHNPYFPTILVEFFPCIWTGCHTLFKPKLSQSVFDQYQDSDYLGEHWIAIFSNIRKNFFFWLFGDANFKVSLRQTALCSVFNRRQVQNYQSWFCRYFCILFSVLQVRSFWMCEIVSTFNENTRVNDLADAMFNYYNESQQSKLYESWVFSSRQVK